MSEPDGTAIRAVVIDGGEPTPEQAAALAAVLLRPPTSIPARPATRVRPGWRTAALQEGFGAVRVADPGQLRELTGPG